MLQLPSTKYPNVQRTVTGLVDVFPDDVILNCDTATGTVTISLGEIPYDATTGVGFWSTQYKLYINDISNNAGTNNITLVAGLGQTINNQATVVLNTNGANAYVIISGNTEYSVFFAPQQAIPSNFITVTWAQLNALITTNTLIPNADYHVTDAEFGSTPIILTNIYIKALTTNTVSQTGQGYFYNADYQGVGDYSGITGFSGQLGVWTSALVTALNSVVIWNNFQYKNITGANGITNPSVDAVNWLVLPYSATNGYIVDVSFISYNASSNRILIRIDKSGNSVERAIVNARNSFNFFKWGSVDVKQNTVSSNSILVNCNTFTGGLLTFFGNTVQNDSEVVLGDLLTEAGTTTLWNFNTISQGVVRYGIRCLTFVNNRITNLTLEGDNSGNISNNILESFTLTAFNNSGDFTGNQITNIRTFTITSNTGTIVNNIIFGGSFIINIDNLGSIGNNNLFNSSLTIDTNSATGSVEANEISSSQVTLANNNGEFNYNNVLQDSFIQITTQIRASGILTYTLITEKSQLIIDDLIGTIGSAVKGKGNTISGNSVVTIGEYGLLSQFYANTIAQATILTVTTFNGVIAFSSINSCEFYFNSLALNTIQAGNFSTVTIGNLGLTYNLQSSIQGETAILGLSTVPFTLDCSDPTIYNGGTQTLTIPSDIALIGGVYTLTNAGGITITKIISLSNEWRTTFFNDNAITTFQSNAIAGAVATDIVSSSGGGAFSVVYRALGQDSMVIRSRQNLAVVKESNILT